MVQNSTNGSLAHRAAHQTNGTSSSKVSGKTETARNSNGLSNGIHKHSPSPSWQSSFLATTIIPILLMMLPNVTLWIWYTAVHLDGSCMECISTIVNSPNGVWGFFDVWSKVTVGSRFSVIVIGGYMLFQIVLMVVVPGKRVEGPVTPTGNIPVYKDNGLYIYLITMASFGCLTFYMKMFTTTSPSLIYDNYGDLLATINVFALIFCLLLYLKGVFAPSSSDSGSSGNPIFDYYWGTELYPRIFGIDVKVFTNCRFGCTVWALLPCCFTMKAYEMHGFDASINSIVSIIILTTYLTKFFWWEAGYMCTIDIILDRAGYYICWGCLCFIPGLYTTFSIYMVNHPIALGYPMAAVILGSGIACIAVNYAADRQKQIVRATDGKVLIWGKKPEVIRAKYRTSQGEEKCSILLVSGFWGLARHFHYLPEIGLAFFWTIPSGFSHILPYFYLTFLTVLLCHRTYRDDIKCMAKYGTYWQEYREKVPYRIIPYVF